MRLASPKFSIAGLMATLGTLALLAAGCGTGSTNTTIGNLSNSQVFNWQIRTGGSGDIKGLDPDTVTSFTSAEVQYLIYDGLVTLDKNELVEPWGATKWDISPDGLTYTFHLRSGQKFADGTAVTANDYAYSMDRSMNPCLASPVSYYLTGQAGVELVKDSNTYNGETCTNGVLSAAKGQTAPVIQTLIGDSLIAVDPLTLKIQLTTPATYFLAAMTYPTAFAIEKSVIDANGGLASSKWQDALSGGAAGQGTSGMFRVVSWDHAAGHMVLKPNPNWWGKVKHLTEVDLTFFKSADTAYSAYQAGQFDNGVPTAPQLADAKLQPDFHSVGLLQFFAFMMQWNAAPFDNLDARQAVCLAFNRTAVNNSVLKGSNIPNWNIVPKGMPGYNPDATGPDGVKDPAGDATKAAAHWQAYLTAAGSKAVKTINYTYVSGSTTADQEAQAFQQQVQTALPGVTIHLNPIDANHWYDLLTNGQFTGFMDNGWIDDYPDPQDFLTLLYSTHAGYNVQHASVPAADTLMIAADKNPNVTQRMQQYNQAEQLLVNNVASCPLFQVQGFYRVRQTVHGFVENAGGFNPNDNFVGMYKTNS
jgi:oligopeptide transport system substrate-binding protein